MLKKLQIGLWSFATLLWIGTATPAWAQPFGPAIEELTPLDVEGKIIRVTGLLFGDAFKIQQHHLEEFEGESGWWTRRIYGTMDFTNFGLGKTVARIRLEVNQEDDFTGNYKSNLKDLYFQFRPGEHRIWVGRVPTLTFAGVEAHWSYRWFEKTPMDIQGVNSRLDGLRAVGPIIPGKRLYYRFALGQSRDLGFETDDVNKAQLAITYFNKNESFYGDIYFDYLEEDEEANEDTAWSFQLSGGWNGRKNDAGWLYFQREWENNPAERLRVVSAYFVHMFKHDHVNLVARIDRLLDPSVKGDGIDYIPFDPSAKATLLMAGVDIKLHKNVDIMPNIKYTFYDTNDEGIRPDDDVYLNLTLSVTLP